MTHIVTVDIGGTHARFARAHVQRGRVVSLGEEVVLKTAEHEGLPSAWDAAMPALGGPRPSAAAIAIAAPLGHDVIHLTNASWTIRSAQIDEELGLAGHILLNDFAAVAHAVAQAGDQHFTHLIGPPGPLPLTGSVCIVGPGTGLGVAQLCRTASDYRVNATEGGHVGFAAEDDTDDAIQAALRARYGRVSVERVVSGSGLVDIYRTLGNIETQRVLDISEVDLWSLALSGTDTLATAALERFCMVLGSFAGDIALAQGADAVVIAGGLGYRLRNHLTLPHFSNRFRAKGRFAAKMQSIPVKLITHPQPGLFGAAAAFASEIGNRI